MTIKDYNFTGNGLAEIKAGTLKVLSSAENARDFDITANIYANSTLDYVAKTGSIITLDNNSNLNFAKENSNATAIISNANVIWDTIANETGNNIVLDNANIVLLNGTYKGNYTVQNGSTLNLMNKEISSLQKIETYNFNKFVSDGTNNLTIDVSLGDDGYYHQLLSDGTLGSIIYADFANLNQLFNYTLRYGTGFLYIGNKQEDQLVNIFCLHPEDLQLLVPFLLLHLIV